MKISRKVAVGNGASDRFRTGDIQNHNQSSIKQNQCGFQLYPQNTVTDFCGVQNSSWKNIACLLVISLYAIHACQPAAAEAEDKPVLHADIIGPVKTITCPDGWNIVGEDCTVHALPRHHPIKNQSEAPMQNTYPLNHGSFNDGGY